MPRTSPPAVPASPSPSASSTHEALFAVIVQAADAVAATTSRTAKIGLLADVLGRVGVDEIEPAIGFLTASVRQGRLGVGWRTIADLAEGAAASADQASLTITEVDAAIERLAALGGTGSAAARTEELTRLWGRATTDEQRLLTGILLGELRIGALEGVLTDAVAKAAGRPLEEVRRAAMLTGSLGRTAYLALTGADLAGVGLTVGVPLLPMLAATASSPGEAVTALGPAPVSVEVKLDGARIQAHRHGGPGSRVEVFSRTLADITARVPELVEVVSAFPGGSLILDGETLTLDEDGAPRPFQETMSRFGSTGARAEILRPWFFDILHADGVDLIDEPLSVRAERLREAVGEHGILALETADPIAAETFSQEALAAGHEGVLVKALDSPYAAGRRGRQWLKVKPVHTYDLVVLAAEWGSGRRTGWLSNLHLGARDPGVPVGEPGAFVMVGKTFKGLTDEVLRWQTTRLLELETKRTRYAVHVTPALVVEIAIDGVQRSSRYPGGLALRFARVKGYREDKAVADADTIEAVARPCCAERAGSATPRGRRPRR
ncbi:MAG: ATP-dependent DNA ligase [Actinomycetales bacterium]|uniref:DNA ligase n=1 Tax=Candidatus Phosphoribacter hodrii TaxID=2953743 RepID=A0A9D7XWQ9_9MICO|nr:ATP-dependent DNA ligase [Candidatus Phosphoribacter hodrii]